MTHLAEELRVWLVGAAAAAVGWEELHAVDSRLEPGLPIITNYYLFLINQSKYGKIYCFKSSDERSFNG